jgi:hypothetical protein
LCCLITSLVYDNWKFERSQVARGKRNLDIEISSNDDEGLSDMAQSEERDEEADLFENYRSPDLGHESEYISRNSQVGFAKILLTYEETEHDLQDAFC